LPDSRQATHCWNDDGALPPALVAGVPVLADPVLADPVLADPVLADEVPVLADVPALAE
jgi:hypothetical protein